MQCATHGETPYGININGVCPQRKAGPEIPLFYRSTATHGRQKIGRGWQAWPKEPSPLVYRPGAFEPNAMTLPV